jgi:hypothetical protein
MAIVGDAYVVVRAITTSVEKDIQKAFNGVDRVGEKAGKDISSGITRGVRRSGVDFDIFNARFRTHDGTDVDLAAWTLDKHYEYYNYLIQQP